MTGAETPQSNNAGCWAIAIIAGLRLSVSFCSEKKNAASEAVESMSVAAPVDAAGQPVAVLTAETALVFERQIGDFLRDSSHSVHIARIVQVEQRSNVQTADASVPIKRTVSAVPPKDLAESRRKLRQLLWCDSGVFDKSDRFTIAGQAK